jgi:hypothetical protein
MADYYSVIASAVSRSSSKTDEARRAIYERARTALREALRDYEPPLLANEHRRLQAGSGLLEADRQLADNQAELAKMWAEVGKRSLAAS